MRLKLGTRLGLGYGAVTAALLLVFVLSVMAFEVSRTQALNIRREYLPSIAASDDMLLNLDRLERAESMTVAGSRQAFETLAAAFRGSLHAAEHHAHTPEEQEVVSTVGQSFGAYMNVASRIRALILEGRPAEARRLNGTESAAAADELRAAIRAYRSLNYRAILAEQEREERILRIAEWVAGSVALLALVLAALTWRRTVQAIVAPLQSLEAATAAIAAGHFTTASHPESGRTREIAALEQDFNAMARQLERMTRGLEAQVADRTHELQTTMEELERLVVQLRGVDKLKSDLMAVVSHELLTPINFIMAYASTLEEEVLGPLAPEQVLAARRIVEGAQRLTRMVRNVLDYTQLESGRLTIRPETLDYAPLVRDVVETMRPLASDKSQTLELVLPSDLPPAWADPSRVAQILQELLDNAFKFTSERGRIRLAVSHDDRALVTEVNDTGIGMPVDIQDNLFKGFYQADNTSTRAYGGLGLGLSIVHHLVTRMGGAIAVDSVPGMGSTFRFTLPRADRREG